MKKAAWIIIVLLIVIAGYVAAGPFLTAYSIRTALVEQDSEKLSDNIDFPALRQNVKDQFRAIMMKKASTELQDNPFAAIATGFAAKMADGVVDTVITPSGLASLMEKKTSKSGHESESDSTSSKKEDLFKNARYSYDSFSKFSVWVPNDKGEELRFVLKREGFSWKLVNIVIPVDKKS
ncbi:DUF2939 domain-containing protein [Syntrophus aciditrophicus]|uniref:Hypothetical exported protein n=1 Tax=Syntrophus aciditrophicus (strain SB) TaxID=56780 RepID=Q2LV96_SYNAS|nr:DUF2939 domain-containing protein [Syntrophus aciditrophicus]ABC78003.1 hypothetical exported protein [Syntrophus aciditrophicus SB]